MFGYQVIELGLAKGKGEENFDYDADLCICMFFDDSRVSCNDIKSLECRKALYLDCFDDIDNILVLLLIWYQARRMRGEESEDFGTRTAQVNAVSVEE